MKLSQLILFFLAVAARALAFDDAAFQAAVALYHNHKPLEAEQAFAAIAATNPTHAETQFYLGQLALRRNDNEKAVNYFEKAAALSPASSEIQLGLGDAYGSAAEKAGIFSKLGLANKCKAAYQKAVELNPASVDAHYSLMNFYLLAPSFIGGGTDKAMVEAEAVKKLDAEKGRFAVSLVFSADKKYDEAFAEFEQALKTNPDDFVANFQVGRLAAISGLRLDQGAAALRRCLALPDLLGSGNVPNHSRAQWRLGIILEKKGDKAGARSAYEASLALDPGFSLASEALKKLQPSS